MWGMLLTFLFTVAAPLVVRVLLALGIGAVTYTGADFLVTEAETYVLNSFTGIGGKVYTVLSMAGIDQGIRIVFAAAGAYIAIKVAMGAFTKITMTNPA